MADPKDRAWRLLFILAAGLAHLPFLLPTPLWLQAIATLVLAGLLPGALLVELLIGWGAPRLAAMERAVLSIGAGYSSMVMLMLLLSYLPGGLSRSALLIAADLLLLTLAVVFILTRRSAAPPVGHPAPEPQNPAAQRLPTTLIIVSSILLVGGFLRLANLGYGEFQGDEARLALRAAEVIQGYENALFVHKKGPTEILLPTAIYVMSERLNEVAARLPFALASLTGLVATFCLGRRLFGSLAGWAAAMLLAVDGYLIAFGRVGQYE
ncbi:MAG TPA: hypothetical protein PKE45_10750, partial [Caldilineaceae bacterium]|nr:hypothetical protein [Caldilineaceae bacterium]